MNRKWLDARSPRQVSLGGNELDMIRHGLSLLMRNIIDNKQHTTSETYEERAMKVKHLDDKLAFPDPMIEPVKYEIFECQKCSKRSAIFNDGVMECAFCVSSE